MGFPLFLLIAVGIGLLAVNRWQNRRRLPPGTKPLPGPMSEYLPDTSPALATMAIDHPAGTSSPRTLD